MVVEPIVSDDKMSSRVFELPRMQTRPLLLTVD
jgi:hypothetical protein